MSCQPLTGGTAGLSRGGAVPQASGALPPTPLETGLAQLSTFTGFCPYHSGQGRPQALGPGTDFSHVSEGAAMTGEFRQRCLRFPSTRRAWTWPRRESSRPRAGQSPAGGGCSGSRGQM